MHIAPFEGLPVTIQIGGKITKAFTFQGNIFLLLFLVLFSPISEGGKKCKGKGEKEVWNNTYYLWSIMVIYVLH